MFYWFKLISFILLFIVFLAYLLPYGKRSFEHVYNQEDHFSKSLKEFRSRPLKNIVVDGIKWQYYSGGQGKKCIVFIHGMGGSYDFWWNQILFFEKDFRIISYTLPKEINSLKRVEEGISAILKQEKVDKFIPIGTSMGGYITQYLLHRHPNKIEKAVLGNTFPPNDLIQKENAVNRKLIPILPTILVGTLAKNHLKKDIFPTSENNELLKSFLLSAPFNKESLTGRYDVVTDYFEPNTSLPKINTIPKLIIESDNDPMIAAELRKKLKEIYPEAKVHTFHNKGHFPYINAVEQYNITLKKFLEEID